MASRPKKRSSAANAYKSQSAIVTSDSDDQGPSKRARTAAQPGSSESLRKVDSNGDSFWEISNQRRITISSFRGKTIVNIREYYEKDGQELPGKKGISLPLDQFRSFIRLLPEIEGVLLRKGESMPRPDYRDGDNEKKDIEDQGLGKSNSTVGKKNIEATSDEDEGGD